MCHEVVYMDYSEMGAIIRRRRKELGMSTQELANALGIKAQSVGRIERGEKGLSLDTFLTVCRVLRIPPAELLKNYLTFN